MKITKSKNKFSIWSNESNAGFIEFEIKNNVITVNQLQVKDEFQRQGFASKLVTAVLELKLPLTGIILTDYAAKFWSHFDLTIPVNDEAELKDWIDNYGILEVNKLNLGELKS